jgi:amino acid permease
MNFEARDLVLIALGGAFGVLLVVAAGLDGATAAFAGFTGCSSAAALCALTRSPR